MTDRDEKNPEAAFSRFLLTELDTQYLEIPGDWVEEGEIPEEEMEVRRYLAGFKMASDKVNSFGCLSRLFKSEEYRAYKEMFDIMSNKLLELVNKTPEHKAALHRIVNAMPENNGGRQALEKYLK
ncbi:hypothetical protein EIM70_22650 [Salmonella enterica]|uniref:hypothetical protein n=1 Tax=Klebsiella pneumoniae TaxID=573 RepID=UPI001278309C|nr:hypothetical protein [Salmonella enterica]EEC2753753.1 hypothetical protein [Salmonella enterica]EKY8230894.1 hypothetical protein [Salmonella enterica]